MNLQIKELIEHWIRRRRNEIAKETRRKQK